MIIYETYYKTTAAELLTEIRKAGTAIGLVVSAEDSTHIILTDGKYYYSYLSGTNYLYESYSVKNTYNGNYLTDAIYTKQVLAFASPNYRIMVAAWKYNDDYGIGIYQAAYTIYAFPVRLSRLATSAGRNIYVLTGDSTPVYYDEDGNNIGTWASQIAALTMNEPFSIYKRNQNVTGIGGLIVDNEFFKNAYNICLYAAITDRRYELIANDGRYFFPSQSLGSAQNFIIKHEEV